MAKTTTYTPRLKQLFADKIAGELKTELKLDNVWQVPRLYKIIVAVGIGKQKDDKRHHELVLNTLRKITGQQPVDRIAKKSIATFKIRAAQGSPIGVSVTLRGNKMYEFLDRLVSVVLPRVRDFHGVSNKSFDKNGNFSLGLDDQSVFPELTFEDTQILHGLQITCAIKNSSPSSSKLLLASLGMPFEKTPEKETK